MGVHSHVTRHLSVAILWKVISMEVEVSMLPWQEEPANKEVGIPLHAPSPVPPEWEGKPGEERKEKNPNPRGVVEDIGQEFLI